MSEPDFKVIDMPTLLGRSVRKPDPVNPHIWVRDEDWYARTRKKHAALALFLKKEGLIRPDVVLAHLIDDLVLRRSELTDLGLRLVKSGAVDRWYRGQDRNPNRNVENVEYLRRELKKLRGRLA